MLEQFTDKLAAELHDHQGKVAQAADNLKNDLATLVVALEKKLHTTPILKNVFSGPAKFVPSFNTPFDRRPHDIMTINIMIALAFFLAVSTILWPHDQYRRARIWCVFFMCCFLMFARSLFTAGSPSEDYNTASPVLGLTLAIFEFYVLSSSGDDLRWMGPTRPGTVTRGKKKAPGIGEEDCVTWQEKIRYSFRFFTNLRGIGWNWQVKNVPHNYDAGFSRRFFVAKHLFLAADYFFWGKVALYVLGACKTLQVQEWASGRIFYFRLLDGAVGWCGASWTYYGLLSMYSLCAAITVALNICDPWEWPPVVGKLSDAWSVRQMWGVTWHQNIRRRIEMISVPLTRMSGFPKGSIGSRYIQLFIGFGISMLIHKWSSFVSAGRDLGEFKFFMAQPFAIMLEDIVQYYWRQTTGKRKTDRMTSFERIAGYVWTFAWFSYTLGPFAQEMLEAQNIGAEWGGMEAMVLGSQHAFLSLQGLGKDIFTKKSAWMV